MRIRPIFKVLFLFLLLGCKKDQRIDSKKIIGLWNIERDAYTKGTLRINENQTFKFKETAHLSETFSEGIWKIKKDTLFLNSKPSTECLYLNNFSPFCEDEFIVVKPYIETTIENCHPDNFTKYYTSFNQEKFIVKNDSLIYINENKNCENEQFGYRIYK